MSPKRARLLSVIWGLFALVNVVQLIYVLVTRQNTAMIFVSGLCIAVGLLLLVSYARLARR